MFASALESPIGELVIRANDQEVFFVGFPEEIPGDESNQISEAAIEQFKQFKAYFEGKFWLFNFTMRQPGTEFQQSVWKELTTIPAGKPISYAHLSRNMNNPLAIRAIASANGKNNLMIAVPCHHVVGSNGELLRFGGGLWRKKGLLDNESKMLGIGQAILDF